MSDRWARLHPCPRFRKSRYRLALQAGMQGGPQGRPVSWFRSPSEDNCLCDFGLARRGEKTDLPGDLQRFAPDLAGLLVRSARPICDHVKHLQSRERATRDVDLE